MAELSFRRSPLAELIGFNAGWASLLGFLTVPIGIAMKPLFVETLVILRVLATALSVMALTLTALGALAQPAWWLKPSSLAKWKRLKRLGVMLLFRFVGPMRRVGWISPSLLLVRWLMGRMAINMVQSLSRQLGLRVKQPSVKSVREQFHILSEITQPLTILASRLEPLVPSVALGLSVD